MSFQEYTEQHVNSFPPWSAVHVYKAAQRCLRFHMNKEFKNKMCIYLFLMYKSDENNSSH